MRKIATLTTWGSLITATSLIMFTVFTGPSHIAIAATIGTTPPTLTARGGNTPSAQKAPSIACKVHPPQYTPPPQVLPPDPAHTGDMTYQGGPLVDGIAKIYLIFWQDTAFQKVTPTYVSQIEQFVKDMGQSSYYANLMQYHDGRGRCPVGAQLAGTVVDTRPFPPNLVAMLKNPNAQKAMDSLTGQIWDQEMADVITKQRWNSRDLHNIFVLLPIMSWGCGNHASGVPNDISPSIIIPYPFSNGQIQCTFNIPKRSDRDQIADITINALSYEIPQAVTDPRFDAWLTSQQHQEREVISKCATIPLQIDPKTGGNVTWHGHSYVVDLEYSNLRHGCVLEGP